MSDFTMDWDRTTRTGLPEAVHAAAKNPAQVAMVVAQAMAQSRRLLITRLSGCAFAALPAAQEQVLDYDALSSTAMLNAPAVQGPPKVCIVTGGLADMPCAQEAARVLAFSGVPSKVIVDVGVAGIWRLMDRIEEIRRFDVVIAVAGMEGALFSVLGGLISAPLIALPSPVGDGVGAGGRAALDSALASCASGIMCVNIGNGFGAAHAALRILGRQS